MSWTDEEIDKLFSDSAGKMSFEYKEAYWEEMQAVLPSRKRGVDGLWLGMALVFFSTIGVLMLTQYENETHILTANANDSAEQTHDQPSASKTEGEIPNVNNEESVPVRTDNDAVNPDRDTDRHFTNRNENVMTTAAPHTSQVSGPYTEEMQPGRVQSNPAGQTISHRRISESAMALTESVETVETENPIEERTLALHEFEQFEINASPQSLAFNFDPNKPKAGWASEFYVELNGGLSRSLITPSEHVSTSYGAGSGMRFQKKGLILSAGLNIIVSQHNDIQLNREAKWYGFGSNVKALHLDYDQLYTLEGSCSAGYTTGKHTVTLGVRPSYIINALVNMSRMVDSDPVSQEKSYGYIDELKRWGWKPMMGYAYRFKTWQIGLNVGVQTMPVLHEESAEGWNSHRPVEGQLFIRKSFGLR